MKRQQPAAFLFYVNDFLAATEGLTAEQVGVYVLMLANEWRNGGPFDLLKTCGWLTARLRSKPIRTRTTVAALHEKFAQNDEGLFFSERLEAERERTSARRARNRLGGLGRAATAGRDQGKFTPAKRQPGGTS